MSIVVLRDLFRIPAVEGGAVAVTLVEDGFPRQPGLRAFEVEHLEQRGLVVAGHAPLVVVVVEVALIGHVGPGAAGWVHTYSINPG